MRSFICSMLASERGATAVEYGLILSLIVLGMIGGLSELASGTLGMWENVSREVSNH